MGGRPRCTWPESLTGHAWDGADGWCARPVPAPKSAETREAGGGGTQRNCGEVTLSGPRRPKARLHGEVSLRR